mmetsp:Transcript_29589/g.66319  ORF Transcript_29589/g.66319 Transcript_29589/m.66319 type:complete len:473 (-) Transcript_29589:94-1512(-)
MPPPGQFNKVNVWSLPQVLVTAFERLTQPELVPDGQDDQSEGKSGSKAKKTARISRSNEGCVRTSVHCPRCKQAWGAAVEGNPDWFYNVMMQGLKSFTCATCLCQFGCMTALHKCPQCARTFEYSPQDYHRRVGCGHPKCISSTASKGFGFFLFSMSDRAEAALRAELKTAREQHARVVESARRRAASVAKRRGGGGQGVDAEAEAQASEAAFAAGLSDSCPRCGGSFLAMGGEEDQRQHLLECTDAKAIKAHAEKKRKVAAAAESKASRAALQDDAEALATWQFLGSKPEQLYLLSEPQLAKQCRDRGIALPPNTQSNSPKTSEEGGGRKAALISALVRSDALAVHSGGGRRKRGKLDASTLPENLESLSLEALQAVLAAHGFVSARASGSESATKAELLAHVQAELCAEPDGSDDGDDAGHGGGGKGGKRALLIEAEGGRGSASRGRRKSRAVVEVESEDSEDSAFDPDE